MKIHILSFLVLYLIIAPQAVRVSAEPANTPVPPNNSDVIGKIVQVNGVVKISRPNLRKPLTARPNSQLIHEDKLIISDAATAKVVCFANYQQFNLSTGEHDNPCPESNQATDAFTSTYNRGRAEVIKKDDGRAILIPKANDYREFLAKIMELRPESIGSSISLKELMQNDARNDLVRRIRGMSIPIDEKRLLLVDVYAMNKRYDRAIEQLNGVTNASADPGIQINLGDLYLASNFGTEAKRAYSSAITLAIASDDSMSEALAQQAIGMIYHYEGGHSNEATAALTRAIQLYRDLGETLIANELQKLLQDSHPNSARP